MADEELVADRKGKKNLKTMRNFQFVLKVLVTSTIFGFKTKKKNFFFPPKDSLDVLFVPS